MKVSGFSFIRNAVQNKYPLKEAICSVLSLCDDFYIALGKSSDNTEKYVESIGSQGKLHIIPSVWDDSIKEGGRVFACETNKAMDAIPGNSDWAFYIQADECVHEKYLPVIQAAMEKYRDDLSVDGLLFHYLHFYGSYDYVASSRRWYRREIRVIRNDKKIRSYKDAQGFRKEGKKLNVKLIDAWIYHYGWAQNPEGMKRKTLNFSTFYQGIARATEKVEFDYGNADKLEKFHGTHPLVMRERIAACPLVLPIDTIKFGRNLTLRRKVLQKIEDLTGWHIGEYRNYKLRS